MGFWGLHAEFVSGVKTSPPPKQKGGGCQAANEVVNSTSTTASTAQLVVVNSSLKQLKPQFIPWIPHGATVVKEVTQRLTQQLTPVGRGGHDSSSMEMRDFRVSLSPRALRSI